MGYTTMTRAIGAERRQAALIAEMKALWLMFSLQLIILTCWPSVPADAHSQAIDFALFLDASLGHTAVSEFLGMFPGIILLTLVCSFFWAERTFCPVEHKEMGTSLSPSRRQDRNPPTPLTDVRYEGHSPEHMFRDIAKRATEPGQDGTNALILAATNHRRWCMFTIMRLSPSSNHSQRLCGRQRFHSPQVAARKYDHIGRARIMVDQTRPPQSSRRAWSARRNPCATDRGRRSCGLSCSSWVPSSRICARATTTLSVRQSDSFCWPSPH